MKTITIFLIILNITFLFSQPEKHSVGRAPANDNLPLVIQRNDFAIGTRAFVQIASSTNFQFGKLFMESCTPTPIGVAMPITFPGGLVERNGVIYTWNQSAPFQLWAIDTVVATQTLVFNMTGVPQSNLTGMCWDGTTMYGVSTSITASQIFTVNMTTGVCTPLGTASSVCAGAISLMGVRNAANSLFSLDIVADNCYKWNKSTGAVTLVGSLTQLINFGQDGGVDPNDNKFYCMAYTTASQLRILDTTTGALGPALCTYNAQGTGIAMISSNPPPPPPGAQTTICRGGLNVPINDHSLIKDSVQLVLGVNCAILDVNVRIDTVIHTWDSDLRFYLNSGSVGARIINSVGGSGDNFIGTILNDSAVTPIASGTAPFTGSFIPSSPLIPFNGPFVSGYWKLSISDTATGDTGILKRWCVIFIYTCWLGGIQTIEIPNYYFLKQNYPNPFNPATTIKFGIPESGDIRLVVYDILGREVKVLMNEYKHPGTYEVNFDASELSSGIYFYSLQTQRGTETKRMLLVK